MAEGARGIGRLRSLRLRLALAALAPVALAALPAAAQAGLPYIHAHRGGTFETIQGKQVPKRPEETLATFRHAARKGFVLELDVKLTADGVPVTIHDATLDRTTDCEGEVAALTYAQLRRRCQVDLLGSEGNEKPMGRHDSRRAPVPKLTQVLKMAKRRGARVNLEIKNIPDGSGLRPGAMPRLRKADRLGDQALGLPARLADRAELLAREPRRDRGRSLLR